MTINSNTIIVARMYGMRAIPPPGFNNSWTNDILECSRMIVGKRGITKKGGIDDWEAGGRRRSEGGIFLVASQTLRGKEQPCSKFKGF